MSNTQSLGDPEGEISTRPPAVHLIFLWLFWVWYLQDSSIGYKFCDYDLEIMFCDGLGVREWLRWLEHLISYQTTQKALRYMCSKTVAHWLSKFFFEGTNVVQGESEGNSEYLSWVSSLNSDERSLVIRVSRRDWEKAHGIIESAMGKYEEVPESDVDICAMIGAVCLSTIVDDPSDPVGQYETLASTLKGMGENFKGPSTVRSRIWESLKDLPPGGSSTEMIRFRKGFRAQAAHPACCEEVGDKFIDWYSATVTIMGIGHRVTVDTSWKCGGCGYCKTMKSVQKLFTKGTKTLFVDKQRLMDSVLKEMVSILRLLLSPDVYSHSELRNREISLPAKA